MISWTTKKQKKQRKEICPLHLLKLCQSTLEPVVEEKPAQQNRNAIVRHHQNAGGRPKSPWSKLRRNWPKTSKKSKAKVLQQLPKLQGKLPTEQSEMQFSVNRPTLPLRVAKMQPSASKN